MRVVGIFFITAIVCLSLGYLLAWYRYQYLDKNLLPSPLVSDQQLVEYPYLVYTFNALRERQYQATKINIESTMEIEDGYTSFIFSYAPLGKHMTGQLNIPNTVSANTPVIVMVRGYVPPEIYATGVGTKSGAGAFAKAGFITIAPDFFGVGDSEPEPTDAWQARFEKPIVVIELIKSLETYGVPQTPITAVNQSKLGLWGHSNGGQIALSVLEILQQPIPTSLWAPVTVPFPYSVLFFSDEADDEGKAMRILVNQLERDYDLSQFSLTRYLDGLRGLIVLHHGTADESALIAWSDEFVAKIEKEDDRRAAIKKEYEQSATQSAEAAEPALQPIDITFYKYPGANHNLVPGWDTVVERDIEFYGEKLGLKK
ncbi:MAG: hypothetical protein COY81_02565 [Candidatus Pacebacteria bacterium CG_4_10_14_0_8_um_filter_43_12]|nr:MAG: hypothetical protein COU66_00035 [Candidatus Pacebacteria bacterium CG10_big_fil_rev_8_21_14_0_10_44_11]PIY79424.1 MAG: hypothetical protein COY81_02565 [Candidatus Pacebacteria bacterium CG_4_10_14_0_8_um_filter_43_12]